MLLKPSTFDSKTRTFNNTANQHFIDACETRQKLISAVGFLEHYFYCLCKKLSLKELFVSVLVKSGLGLALSCVHELDKFSA